jgi:PAS domain S-box-containing protein
MTASLRRLTGVDAAAAAYVAIYAGWLAAHTAGFAGPAVGEAAFYPLGLVVGWANWRNSRVVGLDRRTRYAWQMLAGSALILWVTGSAWTVWTTVFGPGGYPSWIDRAAFGQYVLAIAGYLCFPGRAFPRTSRARFGLDAALIVVAGFLIAAFFGLRILVRDPTAEIDQAVVEASLDWVLFVVAAVGMIQKRDRVIRQALALLLVSNVAYLAGNSVLASLPVYRTGDPVDALWFGAWVMRWTAARLAWHHYRRAGGGPGAGEEPATDYRSNPSSYVMVGGAFVLLLARIVARDHEYLAVLVVAAMLMGALLILRQFAELEENRRLLRAQAVEESRFQALVQNSSDVVLVVNDAGLVTYASPSARRVFGPDTVVVEGVMLRQLLPDDEAGVVAVLRGRDPQASRRIESRMLGAPGRWSEIEAVWTDLRHDPAVQGVVINCRDVTDRNAIERHLRQTQKLDAVGHLAGGLAHDLNNVLAIIRGYTDLLRSEMPDGSEAGTDLDHIVEAVDRAAGVTRKVLAFSRKQPAARRLLDINTVVRGLEPMLRNLIKDQVEVRQDLDPGLWRVRADHGQMEQVLVNLATNARDAMPEGGVLRVATANRTIAQAAAAGLPPGDYVELTLADEGAGMSPAVSARIFEPFFSTKAKDRGMGLGLSIVHGIVSDMGGRVLVESAEGEGSTVTVRLPRARDEAGAADPG